MWRKGGLRLRHSYFSALSFERALWEKRDKYSKQIQTTPFCYYLVNKDLKIQISEKLFFVKSISRKKFREIGLLFKKFLVHSESSTILKRGEAVRRTNLIRGWLVQQSLVSSKAQTAEHKLHHPRMKISYSTAVGGWEPVCGFTKKMETLLILIVNLVAVSYGIGKRLL